MFKKKEEIKSYDLNLYEDDTILFQIGNNDIIVINNNRKFVCCFRQNFFDYKGQTNALLGNDPTYHNQLIEIKQLKVYWLKIKDEYTYKNLDPVRHFIITPDENEKLAITETKKLKKNEKIITNDYEKEVSILK